MALTHIAIGAAVLIGLTASTFLLPRIVTVERSAQVTATPANIIARAASNTGYQTFNPYRTADPALKIDPFGPEHGVGSGFHFEGKDGKGSQTVAAVTETSVTYAIDMGAMGQPTQILSARPNANGSDVTWTVEADMGMNPIARVIGLFMDGFMGKTLEQGLTNLDAAS